MADKKIKAQAGMNTLPCPRCKNGTLFIPVTIQEIAEMRASGNSTVKMVTCHDKGHHIEVSLFA